MLRKNIVNRRAAYYEKSNCCTVLIFALSTMTVCGKTESNQQEYSQNVEVINDLPSQDEIDGAFYMVEEAERQDNYDGVDYTKIEIPVKVSLTASETTPINLCVPEEYYVDALQVLDGNAIIKLQAYANGIAEPFWIYLEVGIRKTEQLDNGMDSSAKEIANSQYDLKNIRKGPGTNYDKTGRYTDIGVFTIVAESEGEAQQNGAS